MTLYYPTQDNASTQVQSGCRRCVESSDQVRQEHPSYSIQRLDEWQTDHVNDRLANAPVSGNLATRDYASRDASAVLQFDQSFNKTGAQ